MLKEYKQEAIRLRRLGLSFNAIKVAIPVKNNTLERWLEGYPLSSDQIEKLSDKKHQQIERCRNSKASKRTARLGHILLDQQENFPQFTHQELLIAGLFLYWGEGSKSLKGSISLTNTDPSMLRFFLTWLIEGLGISKQKIRVQLQLYSDMDTSREVNFWRSELKLPFENFNRPYIKLSTVRKISHQGFSHGTCSLSTSNIRLKEKIMMQIKAVSLRCK